MTVNRSTSSILDEAVFRESREQLDALLEAQGVSAVELHFYDFDNTVFKSPFKPDWWPADRKWWSDSSSLEPPCVPQVPGSDWWNGKVVQAARKSIADKDVYAVLATGRHAKPFRKRIPQLLKGASLKFDEVHMAPGDSSTLGWKVGLLTRILKRFPAIQVVHIYEDRDHINNFAKHVEKLGRTAVPHRISEQLKKVECTYDEWKEAHG